MECVELVGLEAWLPGRLPCFLLLFVPLSVLLLRLRLWWCGVVVRRDERVMMMMMLSLVSLHPGKSYALQASPPHTPHSRSSYACTIQPGHAHGMTTHTSANIIHIHTFTPRDRPCQNPGEPPSTRIARTNTRLAHGVELS